MLRTTRDNYEIRVKRDILKTWNLYPHKGQQRSKLRELLVMWGRKVALYEKRIVGKNKLPSVKLSRQDEAGIRERAQLVANSIIATTRKREEETDLELDEIETPSRAEMIAETEISWWIMLAVQSVRDTVRKNYTIAWLTKKDELVCKICGPMHMKEQRYWGKRRIPAHPRCRCTPLMVQRRDSRGRFIRLREPRKK